MQIKFFCGLLCILSPIVAAEISIHGIALDLDGRPVSEAMLSFRPAIGPSGGNVITVFSDREGRFSYPDVFLKVPNVGESMAARALGYEQKEIITRSGVHEPNVQVTVIMRKTSNQADSAPASAWLDGIVDREEKAQMIQDCVGCHQVPSVQVRAYAQQISEVDGPDPQAVRDQSWSAIVQYMNYLSAEEFSRGREAGPPDAGRVYATRRYEEVAKTLSTHFLGPMNELRGYTYGAPLAVTPETVIREYEVPEPNAIREALLLGDPPELWVADVSTNRMFAINAATGAQRVVRVPYEGVMGPHSLHRGADGSLWVTPLFTSVIAHLDLQTESWRTWGMKTISGEDIGVHDLSFGYQHELLTDTQGRIWYSDIRNNAVGYLDPETGDAEIYRVPDVPGRSSSGAMLYGLVMTSDRKRIWYSQLGIGSFGSFNIETLEFEQLIQLPSADSGPRRLSISDEDVMYVPLYGSGQLVEYDTVAGRQIGIYDLPDTGSAPYAVTWDPVRRVVWIPTSNGNVIYRFDPSDKSFGVVPLPSQGAFLRMIDVDPDTGVLVTSYANVVDFVRGPRMALTVDPGDQAYPVH